MRYGWITLLAAFALALIPGCAGVNEALYQKPKRAWSAHWDDQEYDILIAKYKGPSSPLKVAQAFPTFTDFSAAIEYWKDKPRAKVPPAIRAEMAARASAAAKPQQEPARVAAAESTSMRVLLKAAEKAVEEAKAAETNAAAATRAAESRFGVAVTNAAGQASKQPLVDSAED